MPGIYVHIPFCKQACHYCDFHFSVSLQKKDAFIGALQQEIRLQRDYFQTPADPSNPSPLVSTIYFGGGTPSLLSSGEIKNILDEIRKNYSVSADAEITLEANPDDLTKEKLKSLKDAGINRLSIGIQSFSDEDLLFMNRVHDSKMAYDSIKAAQDAGFSNITIDFIYGTPTLSDKQWILNLQTAFELGIPHLSCYSLTVEPQTALAQFIKKGTVPALDEAKSAAQFELLMQITADHGYEQYEISNFAKNNMYSLHNSNYWRNEKYLGLGPSAHSYNGMSRQWNVASNTVYIDALHQHKIPFEKEELTIAQQYNEYILTSLRTMWGIRPEVMNNRFGEDFTTYFIQLAGGFIDKEWMDKNNGAYLLTKQGKLFADRISAELFR